jgi:hypothetical protein
MPEAPRGLPVRPVGADVGVSPSCTTTIPRSTPVQAVVVVVFVEEFGGLGSGGFPGCFGDFAIEFLGATAADGVSK